MSNLENKQVDFMKTITDFINTKQSDEEFLCASQRQTDALERIAFAMEKIIEYLYDREIGQLRSVSV